MNKKKLFNVLIFVLFSSIILTSFKKDNIEPPITTNDIVESFRLETGINAIFVVDTSLLNTVVSWQGQGDYPGVDDWATVKFPDNFDLLGGLPGQSEYYTINQSIIDADTIQVDYWESLQVKALPVIGYRPMVGVFDLTDTIVVVISKTLANNQYGDGGAWQIYVANFNEDLICIDTIYLKQ